MEMRARQQLLADALRSDKYKFGRGAMRRKMDKPMMCEFCFAGVMCEEYRLLHPGDSRWTERDNDPDMFFECEGEVRSSWAVPPRIVMDFFGLPRDVIDAIDQGLDADMNLDYLMGVNDQDISKDFLIIADILEREWKLK